MVALLGLLGSVAFAAMAVATQGGSNGVGAAGKVALAVAHFPSDARNTLRDAIIQAKGDDADFLVVKQLKPVDLARFRPLAVAPGIAITPPLC